MTAKLQSCKIQTSQEPIKDCLKRTFNWEMFRKPEKLWTKQLLLILTTLLTRKTQTWWRQWSTSNKWSTSSVVILLAWETIKTLIRQLHTAHLFFRTARHQLSLHVKRSDISYYLTNCLTQWNSLKNACVAATWAVHQIFKHGEARFWFTTAQRRKAKRNWWMLWDKTLTASLRSSLSRQSNSLHLQKKQLQHFSNKTS